MNYIDGGSWLFLLVGIVVYVGLIALGIYVTYVVIKAAVRNGTIEAYIKLRREGLYPPH